jgi:hypothetical protein
VLFVIPGVAPGAAFARRTAELLQGGTNRVWSGGSLDADQPPPGYFRKLWMGWNENGGASFRMRTHATPGGQTGGKEYATNVVKVHTTASSTPADEVGTPTLDEIAREGARRMLVAALEAEVAEYIECHRQERDENGHRRVVRNGHARPRKLTMGCGTVEIAAPGVHDRRSERRFTSQILPPSMRKSPAVAEVLPILYLRGLSTGDFQEALPVLLAEERSAGLSPSVISRLTAEWEEEYRSFQQRDLSERDYVYVWVDGIYFKVRLEEDRLCTLVMIGVRPCGTKELIALKDRLP